MWLPLVHPQLGTWPATKVCALAGNQTHDLYVHSLALDLLSHTSQCIYRFQVYISMIHDLYFGLCAHHPKLNDLLSMYIWPPLLFTILQPPSLWSNMQTLLIHSYHRTVPLVIFICLISRNLFPLLISHKSDLSFVS